MTILLIVKIFVFQIVQQIQNRMFKTTGLKQHRIVVVGGAVVKLVLFLRLSAFPRAVSRNLSRLAANWSDANEVRSAIEQFSTYQMR